MNGFTPGRTVMLNIETSFCRSWLRDDRFIWGSCSQTWPCPTMMKKSMRNSALFRNDLRSNCNESRHIVRSVLRIVKVQLAVRNEVWFDCARRTIFPMTTHCYGTFTTYHPHAHASLSGPVSLLGFARPPLHVRRHLSYIP